MELLHAIWIPRPLGTAAAFLGFVMVVDFFLVAPAINRSLEMFADPLGTWIPFALLFLSAFLTGREVVKRQGDPVRG